FVSLFCLGSLAFVRLVKLQDTSNRNIKDLSSKTQDRFSGAAYINPAVCFHSPRPVLSAVVDLPAVPQATIGHGPTVRVPPPYFVVALHPLPDREKQSRFAWAG